MQTFATRCLFTVRVD